MAIANVVFAGEVAHDLSGDEERGDCGWSAFAAVDVGVGAGIGFWAHLGVWYRSTFVWLGLGFKVRVIGYEATCSYVASS